MHNSPPRVITLCDYPEAIRGLLLSLKEWLRTSRTALKSIGAQLVRGHGRLDGPPSAGNIVELTAQHPLSRSAANIPVSGYAWTAVSTAGRGPLTGMSHGGGRWHRARLANGSSADDGDEHPDGGSQQIMLTGGSARCSISVSQSA